MRVQEISFGVEVNRIGVIDIGRDSNKYTVGRLDASRMMNRGIDFKSKNPKDSNKEGIVALR